MRIAQWTGLWALLCFCSIVAPGVADADWKIERAKAVASKAWNDPCPGRVQILYRDPLNPSDPFHSHDPNDIMYAYIHADRRCNDDGTPYLGYAPPADFEPDPEQGSRFPVLGRGLPPEDLHHLGELRALLLRVGRDHGWLHAGRLGAWRRPRPREGSFMQEDVRLLSR